MTDLQALIQSRYSVASNTLGARYIANVDNRYVFICIYLNYNTRVWTRRDVIT